MMTMAVELCSACTHPMDKHTLVEREEKTDGVVIKYKCSICTEVKGSFVVSRCVSHVAQDYTFWFVEEHSGVN